MMQMTLDEFLPGFIPVLIHLGFEPVNPTEDFGGIPRNFAKHLDKGKKDGS